MTTFIIDAKAVHQEDDKIWLELTPVEPVRLPLEMTAFRSSTIDELAAMALTQAFPDLPDAIFQKRFTIEAHQETINEETFWVVDSVEQEQLPNEAAKAGFDNLPGWASWTASEAAQWIVENVTDLASAKVALTTMAKAIVYLRDWR